MGEHTWNTTYAVLLAPSSRRLLPVSRPPRWGRRVAPPARPQQPAGQGGPRPAPTEVPWADSGAAVPSHAVPAHQRVFRSTHITSYATDIVYASPQSPQLLPFFLPALFSQVSFLQSPPSARTITQAGWCALGAGPGTGTGLAGCLDTWNKLSSTTRIRNCDH